MSQFNSNIIRYIAIINFPKHSLTVAAFKKVSLVIIYMRKKSNLNFLQNIDQ